MKQGNEPGTLQFSGYWFRSPREIEWLFEHLTHAELKVFLVVLKQEQGDRNGARLSRSQLQERTKLTRRAADEAAHRLCDLGLIQADFTKGKTTEFSVPITWRTKYENLPPTGGKLSEAEMPNLPPTGGKLQDVEKGASACPLRGASLGVNLPPTGGIHSSSKKNKREREVRKASGLGSTHAAEKASENSFSGDDEKPEERAEPKTHSEAKERFLELVRRSKVKNPDRLLRIVELKLTNGDLWLEFWKAVHEVTTSPSAVDGGHFVAIAKQVSVEAGAAVRMTSVYDLKPQESLATKCEHCGGGGFLGISPMTACPDCEMGKEVFRQITKRMLPADNAGMSTAIQ